MNTTDKNNTDNNDKPKITTHTVITVIFFLFIAVTGLALYSNYMRASLPGFTYVEPSSKEKSKDLDTITEVTIGPPIETSNESHVETSNESPIEAITLEMNSINNILTWGSFIVAILTIVAAVFGIAGFVELKSGVNNKIKDFENTLKKTEDIEKEFNRVMSKYETLVQSFNAHERYTNKSIEYLYEAIYLFINNPGPNGLSGGLPIAPNGPDDGSNGPVGSNQGILNDLFHKLQILKLYRCSLDDKENEDEAKAIKHGKKTALEYLKVEGTKDDLPDLEYVAKHEQDESIKNRIHEVIGIIRFKYS